MKRTTSCCALFLGIALAVACGSASSSNPDADPNQIDSGVNPDAPPAGACTEFGSPATTLSSYPATYNGDNRGAGADLQVAELVCSDERDWYSHAGEDQVVALTNLTPGTVYAISLESEADLSFYVATDCSDSAGGPAAGQCMLFVDEAIGGTEFGDFTAPSSGSAMIVVDQWQGTEPAEGGTYVLQVWEPDCTGEDDCSDPTPYCYEFECVECLDFFDCDDPASPICDATNSCTAGYDQCTGDDEAENGNDGPAGAVVLEPAAGSPDTVSGAICSLPGAESDFFEITVPEGADRGFILDWEGEADLDVLLIDDEGYILEEGYYEQPEAIRGSDLAAGTYYLIVYMFEPEDTAAAVPYTLTALFPECETSFDCNSPANPVCSGAGTCAAGFAACTGDDNSGEQGDDGPAGATSISVGVGNSAEATGGICNTPGGERDFYSVTVANGDNLTVTLTATGGAADLDLAAYAQDGKFLGFTMYATPEVLTLTNLPGGNVFFEVMLYSESPSAANVAYTISVNRTAGGCANIADCAEEFETQYFRGNCSASACRFIEGDGALADGAACDSGDDCTSGLCSYRLFESDADKSVCTVECDPDADDCATEMGDTYVCTVPYVTNVCHPKCGVNTDCGVDTGSATLDANLPWDYLTCTAATGICDLDP